MKRSIWWGLALTLACSRPAEPPPPSVGTPREAPHRDEEKHEELPSRITLPPEVVEKARLRTAKVVRESLPLTVALTGEIAADPDLSVQLAARVAGRISQVRFKEGDAVEKGQLLAVIESPDAGRARAAARSTAARAQSARQNANRLGALLSQGLSAGQEVKTAEAEATSLEAEAAAARETLRAFGAVGEDGAARLELRAPLSGVVLSRNAVVGQSVQPDYVVGSIADLSEAYFVARLFEKDIARVHKGAPAEVRLNAHPQEYLEGTVESVGRQMDAVSRNVTARIRVKDVGEKLKVGLFGTALVEEVGTEAPRPHLLIPLAAVTRIADRSVVFVRQPDGHFEVHPVTLGRTASGRAEVIAGLREGEEVVVDGTFTLKSAVLKSTFGEDEG